MVEDLEREDNTDWERRIIAGRDSYGNSDRQTVFTARCHPRNAKGLKQLRTAIAKQNNLLLEGKFAWYIDMVPGSVTTSDESEDVLSCEFKFRLREKINRNPQFIPTTDPMETQGQVVATDTIFK